MNVKLLDGTTMPIVDVRRIIVDEALSWKNTEYVFGGKEKGKGVDCSEFVGVPFKVAKLIDWKVQFPRTDGPDFQDNRNFDPEHFSRELLKYGVRVKYDDLNLGDIVSFLWRGVESHVAIVTRTDPCFVTHAVSGSVVREQPLVKLNTFVSGYRHKAIYMAESGQEIAT
jgi:hypothetical protein